MSEAPRPRIGDVWRHFRGGLYRVVEMALLESDASTWMVVYQKIDGDDAVQEVPWVRPVSSWMETAPTGAPRFTLVDRDEP